MQDYRTVQGQAIARIEEKKSEFIAHVNFVDSEQAAISFLEEIRIKHRTARHHVYAYCLREGARMRYSDDGEPAKTSGLPTLEVIRHANLVDCMIVTVRYFGGTLLGTGGLVRAYTAAASEALAHSNIVTVRACIKGALVVDYALYEMAVRLLEQHGAHCESAQFAGQITIPFILLAGGETALLPALNELCRGNPNVTLSQPFYAPF